MITAPTTARKGSYKKAQRSQREATPIIPREAPVFARGGGAIQGEIQNAVLNLQASDFVTWVHNTFGPIDVRFQQIAKTLLSTFIEESLRIRHGVYFSDSKTVHVGWVHTSFMKIEAAGWMEAFIEAHPKANWTRKV